MKTIKDIRDGNLNKEEIELINVAQEVFKEDIFGLIDERIKGAYSEIVKQTLRELKSKI